MSQPLSAASAAELARSAFRRLAVLRLPPTPENYARVWAELAHADGLAPQTAPAAAQPQGAPTQTAQPQGAPQAAPRAAPAAPAAQPPSAPGGPAAPAPATAAPRPAGVPPWRQLWEHSMHLGLIPSVDDAGLQQRAGQVLGLSQSAPQSPQLLADNRALWQQFQQLLAHERTAVDGVLELFAGLISHLGEVFAGDTAAAAELGALRQVVQRPLDEARIDLARAVIAPWLQRQAALQRSAVEARVTSQEVAGEVAQSLGVFVTHNQRFNEELQVDLQRLGGGLGAPELAQLAQQMLDRGVALHERSSELGTRLRHAQQQAEQALARIRRLEDELQQASQQMQEDPLTGALNRRGLDAVFARDSARAARLVRPLSVALLDLDHFKQINDSYGHDFGDEVLRGLVQVARKLVRPGDSIARLGGEEFLVLFPDSAADAAQRAVQRMLEGFRQRRMLHRNTGQRVEASFSAGVTQFVPGEDFAALYQRADTALRQAKQEGRRKVLLAA